MTTWPGISDGASIFEGNNRRASGQRATAAAQQTAGRVLRRHRREQTDVYTGTGLHTDSETGVKLRASCVPRGGKTRSKYSGETGAIFRRSFPFGLVLLLLRVSSQWHHFSASRPYLCGVGRGPVEAFYSAAACFASKMEERGRAAWRWQLMNNKKFVYRRMTSGAGRKWLGGEKRGGDVADGLDPVTSATCDDEL